jgi:hypothetical protein
MGHRPKQPFHRFSGPNRTRPESLPGGSMAFPRYHGAEPHIQAWIDEPDGAAHRVFREPGIDASATCEPLRPWQNPEARRGISTSWRMNKMNYLRLTLKVCEGCGTLWLRRVSIDSVYCATCARQLSAFPSARGKHAGGRPSRSGRILTRCTNGRFAGGEQ